MCIFVSNFNMGSLATPERCSKLLRVNDMGSLATVGLRPDLLRVNKKNSQQVERLLNG